jgi:hypothetical protein
MLNTILGMNKCLIYAAELQPSVAVPQSPEDGVQNSVRVMRVQDPNPLLKPIAKLEGISYLLRVWSLTCSTSTKSQLHMCVHCN